MMMKVLVAFALFAFASAIQNYNVVEDARLFGEFIRTYNKKYESGAEFQKRFQIFANNLREIERKNRESKGAVFNVTKFADMTKEEFRKYPCGVDKLSELNDKRPGFVPPGPTEPTIVNPNLPTSFDWTTKGAVTPVKDQQQCGSCWAFSVIGNAEGVWFLAGNQLTGLSEEQLVSCSTTDYGCSGGWPFWAWTDMLASPYSGRIDTESGYPYTSGNGDNGVCQFGTNDVGASFTKYTSYCNEQTAACSETDMQQWLITYGPLSVCLDADPMQFYQGGVDNPTDCDPNAIDHCVTLVGYGVDNGTPFWRLKNSWNTNWGEEGYYRLIRGTGACGINKVITIATAKK